MKVAAIVLDTIRELVVRRTVIVLFVLTTLVLLFYGLALRTSIVDGMIAGLSVFGMEGRASGQGFSVNGPGAPATLPAETFVRGAQVGGAFLMYPIGILLSVFATAGLVPRMLEKGTIDLLLSKPIPRAGLLLARALGGWVVAAANILYFTLGLGAILALKTGIWNAGFFASGLLMTLYFACLLAYVVLAGVLLRSTAISIMIAAAVFFASLVVRWPHGSPGAFSMFGGGPWRLAARGVVEAIYHALPATWDFVTLTAGLIWRRGGLDGMPIVGSMLAAGAAFALAVVVFSRSDY